MMDIIKFFCFVLGMLFWGFVALAITLVIVLCTR